MKANIKCQILNVKFSKGFTLVEMLASVIVLVAIGAIVTGMISSSLRGVNKTGTIENIRQNGNYVLNQISKDIAYAQSLDGTNTGFNTYTDPNNAIRHYTSCPPSPPAFTKIIVRSANNILTEYNCGGSTPSDSVLTTNNGTSLIDAVSVSLMNCSFSCTQASSGVPIIGISFTLGPSNLKSLPENNAQSSITFKTSVTMRNYMKQ